MFKLMFKNINNGIPSHMPYRKDYNNNTNGAKHAEKFIPCGTIVVRMLTMISFSENNTTVHNSH